MKAVNRVGQRFGRLVVVRYVKNVGEVRRVECVCDCGNTHIVRAHTLPSGRTKSCGCLKNEVAQVASLKHGHMRQRKASPEYRAWAKMIERCHNSNDRFYDDYGGRGIKVCQEWRDDFAAFLAHVGPKPSAKHSIDRIRVNGGYEPGNVRWATPTQQARNTRRTRWVQFQGRKMSLPDAVEAIGGDLRTYYKVRARLRYGWSDERALSTP